MTFDDFKEICDELALSEREIIKTLGYSQTVLYNSRKTNKLNKPMSIAVKLLRDCSRLQKIANFSNQEKLKRLEEVEEENRFLKKKIEKLEKNYRRSLSSLRNK